MNVEKGDKLPTSGGRELWPKSWARPRQAASGGYVVSFTADRNLEVIASPEERSDLVLVAEGVEHPLPAGSEPFEWQPYSIAAADERLAREHDDERSVRTGPGPQD